MVERHVRDERRVGINDIDRVEASSKPDLQDRHIDIRGLECRKRSECTELEVGQRNIAAGCLDPLERGDNFCVRRHSAIDGDTFVVANHMR
jgi:hypothetical protein